jgi:hypothetical protein
MLLFFVIASVAKQSMPPQAVKWIASSLQRKIALQFCRELPCANASRLSQARTAEKFRVPDYTPPG